jgi:hypothetical protein
MKVSALGIACAAGGSFGASIGVLIGVGVPFAFFVLCGYWVFRAFPYVLPKDLELFARFRIENVPGHVFKTPF